MAVVAAVGWWPGRVDDETEHGVHLHLQAEGEPLDDLRVQGRVLRQLVGAQRGHKQEVRETEEVRCTSSTWVSDCYSCHPPCLAPNICALSPCLHHTQQCWMPYLQDGS